MPGSDPKPSLLQGKRILVVEDEAIVAMLLEDMLADLGCQTVGPAMTLNEANGLIAESEIDAAILDVNVGGERVYPLAVTLTARNVPLVFATGYGEGGLEESWRGRTTVQKPYTEADIVRALKAALGG